MPAMQKMQAQRTREIAKAVRHMALRALRLARRAAGPRPAASRGARAAPECPHVRCEAARALEVEAHGGASRVESRSEDRGQAVLLMIDLSVSGRYGSAHAPKRELAAEAAAVIAFAAIRTGDRVGALLFADRVELYLPPRSGRSQVLRIIREILFREPEGRGADLCGALGRASRLVRRPALILLVSDFLLPGRIPVELTELTRSLRAANRHHDVVAVSVTDPRELELPDLGVVALEDVETGERIEIDTSREATRESYRRAAHRYQQMIARCLRLGGVDRIELSTAVPGMPSLMEFLSRRGATRTS
jgi:uncharacterized protein (DUF58 family)